MIFGAWALVVVSAASGVDTVYFESKELCQSAQVIINKNPANHLHAKTECFRVKEQLFTKVASDDENDYE